MPSTAQLAKTLHTSKPKAQIDAAKQLGKRVTDEALAELEQAVIGFSECPPKVRAAIVETLLEFPPVSLTAEALHNALHEEVDTSPLFEVAPIEAVLDATNLMLKEMLDFVPLDPILNVFVARMDEHAKMKPLLQAFLEELERSPAEHYPDDVKRAKRLRKAL